MIKKISMINFLFSSFTLMSSFSVLSIEPSRVIEVNPKCNFYILTDKKFGVSHNVYVLEMNGEKFFFKECKKKLSMYDTAKRAINEYFGDSYKCEQKSILEDLSDKQNLEKFINIKTYKDGDAAKWIKSEDKSDTSVLGIRVTLSDDFRVNILPKFLIYAHAEFAQYKANKHREIGELQINQQLNALATINIARLLNLSDLVVGTEYVELKMLDGTSRLGIIMDCAKGVPFTQELSSKCKNLTPSFQRNISSLMVLDVICGQFDRDVGNYFTVLSENGDIIGISAYDNELAFGDYVNLKDKRNDCLPAMINSDNTLVLPHIDRSLAHTILKLKDENIKECLDDLLNINQIASVLDRLHQIQNSIKLSIKKNPKFLLEPSEWSNSTKNEELSLEKETYFKYYVRELDKIRSN